MIKANSSPPMRVNVSVVRIRPAIFSAVCWHFVTDIMAKRIVNGFKMVDINERKTTAFAIGVALQG